MTQQPGFTAEASLYRFSRVYSVVRIASPFNGAAGSVVPQFGVVCCGPACAVCSGEGGCDKDGHPYCN